jgi:Flp pilus assembly protein TadD
MSKRIFASTFLSIALLLAFVQHHSVATAGFFDWSALVAGEAVADATVADSNNDTTTKDSTESSKKGSNGFVRIISAPFRALGRLFGGGKKNEQQARGISNKEAEKFESKPLTRIKDSTTPVIAPDANSANSATTTPSSVSEFERHLSKARELLVAGEVDSAINELTNATAINQKSAAANNLLGVAYESKGWRDSALRAFEMAVTLDENNAEHLNNLGFLLYKNGDYERATKFLKRAAKIGDNPRIWNNLGLVYCEREKFDDAYRSFVQAAGEYQGRLNIATQLQQRGHAQDAIKHLEKAQALRPNSAEVLAKLVSLYEMTGRPADAENARRAIVALKTFADANK